MFFGKKCKKRIKSRFTRTTNIKDFKDFDVNNFYKTSNKYFLR